MPETIENAGWRLKLLYDGDCPFCRREVDWLARRDRAGAVALEDIAAPGFDAARYGLRQKQVEGVIHAQLPDGRLVTGMEVFRRLYAAVGLGWLMAPTGWPLLRPVFDWAYRVFARHRVRLGAMFGRACDDSACRRRA
jgi:predicted DCC family thiol-disulfide oxidoreductase YuxK